MIPSVIPPAIMLLVTTSDTPVSHIIMPSSPPQVSSFGLPLDPALVPSMKLDAVADDEKRKEHSVLGTETQSKKSSVYSSSRSCSRESDHSPLLEQIGILLKLEHQQLLRDLQMKFQFSLQNQTPQPVRADVDILAKLYGDLLRDIQSSSGSSAGHMFVHLVFVLFAVALSYMISNRWLD